MKGYRIAYLVRDRPSQCVYTSTLVEHGLRSVANVRRQTQATGRLVVKVGFTSGGKLDESTQAPASSRKRKTNKNRCTDTGLSIASGKISSSRSDELINSSNVYSYRSEYAGKG